ncbi:hypothetical protein [Saccharolobus solfataricus]|nr:hypothetical protein [Saccharolobus solfataricus]
MVIIRALDGLLIWGVIILGRLARLTRDTKAVNRKWDGGVWPC